MSADPVPIAEAAQPAALAPARPARVRLRRSAPDQPGWTRRRCGSGWLYLDATGGRVADPAQLQRIRELVIPPAWCEVWICPDANGHLQAVGTDAKGRRQYLYHPLWRSRRDREKHDQALDFATRLPKARQLVSAQLALPGLPAERVLAIAFRLLDLGLFRIGGESYAEQNGSYGLATLRREHARVTPDGVLFEYSAKSGRRQSVLIRDEAVSDVVSALKRRRGGGPELLAHRVGTGWRDVLSEDINAYLKVVIGPDASAKGFRTWHATVLAAVLLAEIPDRPRSPVATRREIARTMRLVSEQLGNTPAVCRASYVDPRVLDRFTEGVTVRRSLRRLGTSAALDDPQERARIERAVLRLLRPSPGPGTG